MVKNMEKHQLDNLRKEIKYLIPIHELAHYKNIIYQLGWIEEFPLRTIHSIYFDTIEDDFLFDSVYGINKREKIRLRYYDNYSDIHFERKIKNDQYGFKLFKKYSNEFSINKLKLDELGFHASEWVGYKIFCASFIKYKRNYYTNLNNKIRITFDFDLETDEFHQNTYRTFKNHCILEVKLGIHQHFNFPFNLMQARFSKYVYSRIGDDMSY
jgi:hypothetical protein